MTRNVVRRIMAVLMPNASEPRERWRSLAVLGVMPVLVLVLAVVAAWLRWDESVQRIRGSTNIEAIRAASDSAVAMLSYHPKTAESDFEAVCAGLTDEFCDTYTALAREVVLPAAAQQNIRSEATVPAAAVESADTNRAVLLLSVNQMITIGNDAPSMTTSSVRVTVARVDGRWLVSDFTPI